MAFYLSDGSIFLHMPRCGGTYVTEVLRRTGVLGKAIGRKHDCPGVVPMDMTVWHRVFIRHPYQFIRSVWALQHAWDWPTWPKHRNDGRWWHPFAEINDPPFEARDDFSEFVWWVATERTGWVTSLYVKFADWPTSDVYDTDWMKDDLPELLYRLGVDPVAARVAMASAAKARNSFPHSDDAHADAIRAFEQAEQTAYRRFGYGKKTT
jgi:hypothetical protein